MKEVFSDYIASRLFSSGLSTVFAITGAGSIRLIESFVTAGCNVKYLHHEQAVLMAAIAHFRVTGTPAVCVLTGGPGAINSMTGLASAFLDSIPCIVIAGQEKSEYVREHSSLRAYGVQGLDMVTISQKVVKRATSFADQQDLAELFLATLKDMFHGRAGPVWLDIPQDVQWKTVNKDSQFGEWVLWGKDEDDEAEQAFDLAEVISLTQAATRPLLYIGHGVRLSGAIDEAIKLVGALGFPVLSSWQAADIVKDDNPYFCGRAGTYGQRWANIALQKCDLLLAIGTRLAIPQRGYSDAEFCPNAKKVIVDIDAKELSKFKFTNAMLIESDAKRFITQLLPQLSDNSEKHDEWFRQIKTLRAKFPMVTKPESPLDAVDVYRFVDTLSDFLADDEIIITDMGSALTVTHSTLRLKKDQRLITSTGLGEMGYGLPAAIGAALADDDRRVTLLVGEGSLMMNFQELETLSRLTKKPKIILLNNNGYLTIKHTHRALYGENKTRNGTDPNTGVTFPDFSGVLGALGLSLQVLNQNDQIKKTLADFYSNNSDVLEVALLPDQELIPKTAIKVDPAGEITSPPLEDMYPFLSSAELASIMSE